MAQDKLDEVPQITQDWANHVIYGGLLGLALAAVARVTGIHHLGLFRDSPLYFGLFGTAVVAIGKKVYDYFDEHETFLMCAEKALVTCFYPGVIYGVARLVKQGLLS